MKSSTSAFTAAMRFALATTSLALAGTAASAAVPPQVCPGDANGDLVVNFADVIASLAAFGGAGPAGDADGNCAVNFSDIIAELANFGATCPWPRLTEPGTQGTVSGPEDAPDVETVFPPDFFGPLPEGARYARSRDDGLPGGACYRGARIFAQGLSFQTDGPIICQALFQRLAPRAPMYSDLSAPPSLPDSCNVPDVWKVDPVPWNRDVAPQNKIDDRIGSSALAHELDGRVSDFDPNLQLDGGCTNFHPGIEDPSRPAQASNAGGHSQSADSESEAVPSPSPSAPGLFGGSGESVMGSVDLAIPGRGFDFVWERTYRSRSGADSPMGVNWDHSHNIFVEACGTDLVLHDGRGRADRYFLTAPNTWHAPEFFRVITRGVGGDFTVTFRHGTRWILRALDGSVAQGKATSVVDRNGNTMRYDYDALGRLIAIHDTLDDVLVPRVIAVAYNAQNRVETVTDWTGREVRYEYYGAADPDGALGDLKSSRSPIVVNTADYNVLPGHEFLAGKTTDYTYSRGFADGRLNHNLLTITDPKGQLYCSVAYGATLNPSDLEFDRVMRVTLGTQGPAGDIIDIVYIPQAPLPANNFARLRVVMNDRVGNVRERFYDFNNRLVMAHDYTGRAPDPDAPTTDVLNRPGGQVRASDPALYETRFEYNADALLTRMVLPSDSEIQYQYDSANPGRRAQANLLSALRLPGPIGAAQASLQVLLTNYSPHNFPGIVIDPRGSSIQYSYDAAGNRIQRIGRVPSVVDAWTFNAFGQVTSHTWPDNGSAYNRIDTFDYYTPADGYQYGYLRQRIVDSATLALTKAFEYDRAGNVVRIVDQAGFDWLYDYDQSNRVLRARTPLVALPSATLRYDREYFYDANENLVRADILNVDDQGVVSVGNPQITRRYNYDILNRLAEHFLERDSAYDILTRYGYDANGNVVEVQKGQATSGADPFNIVRYEYDERDLGLRRIRGAGSPDQSSDRFDWNLNGNSVMAVYRVEVVPQLWLLTLDGYDRDVKVTDPMGNEESYAYDANGNMVQRRHDGELVDGPGGAGNVRLTEVTYMYDAMDRRTQSRAEMFDPATQLPVGSGVATMEISYTAMSRPKTVTDANLNAMDYVYDSAGRRLTLTDPKGNTITRSYDSRSNMIAETTVEKSDLGDPDLVFMNTAAYDEVNRRSSFTDNIGNSHEYAYDSRGNRTTQVDARGNIVRYDYDGLNRMTREDRILTSTGDGAGVVVGTIVTTQTWDDSSRLTGRTDGNGNISSYSYDALDRLVSRQFADLTMRTVSYDGADNPISHTDANGSVVTGVYDLLNRLESRGVTPGPGVLGTTGETYEYDGLSRLVRASDNDTDALFTYDSMSNRTSESMQVLPAGPVRLTSSAYDGVGNRTALAYPGGRMVSYSYEALDRISSIVDGVAGHIASQTYSGPACIEQRDCSNDTRVRVDEDSGKRTVGTVHSRISTGTPFEMRSYARDRMHQKQVENNPLAPMPPDDLVYSYDSVGRLVRTQKIPFGPPPPATVYTLDSAGNRQNVSGTVDPGVYTMNPAMPNPADLQMNQYSQAPFDSRVYDSNGNMIQNSAPVRTYAYDFQDRLVRHQNGAVVTQYAYDALGRRVQKQVGAVRTRFYYDGWREIEEQDGLDLTAGTLVHGNAIDELVQMVRGAQRYFFHTDDLGTTRKVTDGLGNVVEQYTYQDFGRPSFFNAVGGAIANTAIGNAHLFTGRRYDSETELYYFRHRYLDPRAGRFITHDAIGDWGDEANIGNGATYAGNNPTSRTDPLGLQAAGSGYTPIAGQWAYVLSPASAHQWQLSNWSPAQYQLSNWTPAQYQLSQWSPAQYVLSRWTPWQCVPSVWSLPNYVLSRWGPTPYVLSQWGPTPYVLSPAGPTPYILSPSSVWVQTNPFVGDRVVRDHGGSALGP